MRIIGPNCLGVIHPPSNLNASFAAAMAKPGNVALLSQSGAICTSILDWAMARHFGFSSFVSVGAMLDVDFADLIDYFVEEPNTRSIVLYMESIGNVRKFLSAARAASRVKHVIVVKAGRHEAGAKAAASHTGSLTGSDEVLSAAFRRCGVLRVDSIAELFYMAGVLAHQLAVGQTAEELARLDQRACPVCGITFYEFRNHGRLGCPHDYICFHQELEPLIDEVLEHAVFRSRVMLIARDALQRFRVEMAAVRLDLEATKREQTRRSL